jgi:hypothetical protein
VLVPSLTNRGVLPAASQPSHTQTAIVKTQAIIFKK